MGRFFFYFRYLVGRTGYAGLAHFPHLLQSTGQFCHVFSTSNSDNCAELLDNHPSHILKNSITACFLFNSVVPSSGPMQLGQPYSQGHWLSTSKAALSICIRFSAKPSDRPIPPGAVSYT